jgi:hypothetical protein
MALLEAFVGYRAGKQAITEERTKNLSPTSALRVASETPTATGCEESYRYLFES